MISIREKALALGNAKLANTVQSVIVSILDTRFPDHPKVDSCVRFLTSYVRTGAELPVGKVFAALSQPFWTDKKPNADNIMWLVTRLSHCSSVDPSVVDQLERSL